MSTLPKIPNDLKLTEKAHPSMLHSSHVIIVSFLVTFGSDFMKSVHFQECRSYLELNTVT